MAESDNWYENNIRGLEISLKNNDFLNKLFIDDSSNKLFEDKTVLCMFALVLAIYKGKEPKYYERSKLKDISPYHEVRSEWGTTDLRTMCVKLVRHKFNSEINKIDTSKIPLKAVSSLVQQGLDIIEDTLKTEVTWDRLGVLLQDNKLFDVVNYDYSN